MGPSQPFTSPLNCPKKAQKLGSYRGIGLLIYSPARGIVFRPCKPMMTGTLDTQGFGLGVFVAQRGKESLRLVVMDDRVFIAVNDEISGPRSRC